MKRIFILLALITSASALDIPPPPNGSQHAEQRTDEQVLRDEIKRLENLKQSAQLHAEQEAALYRTAVDQSEKAKYAANWRNYMAEIPRSEKARAAAVVALNALLAKQGRPKEQL